MARAIASPYETEKPVKIVLAGNAKAAERWRDRGYTPIECSFGEESIVDEYELDHHGPRSGLEGVAKRAYRDQFGARRADPRFVAAGFPDEDATFAIACHCGIIPHPSQADRFPNMPRSMAQIARQNLQHVADEINRVDVNPDLAVTLVDTYFGRVVLSWRQQAHPTARDLLAWYGGVSRWRDLLTAQSDELVNAAADSQEDRLGQVGSASSKAISSEVVVVDFSNFGPNSRYYRLWLERYELLVAFIGGPTGYGTCSFVVRDMTTAQRFYGERGMLDIFQLLVPGRCGGRQTIGGSSRTGYVDWSRAISYGEQLSALIRR